MTDRIQLPETISFLLSVNDSPTFNRSLYEWLLRRNTAVIRVNNTADALGKFHRVSNYDVVVTNLRRKENGYMNPKAGIELAASIRRQGYNVPIILYSMNIEPAIKYEAIKAGVNHVTVVPSELRTLLQKYL